MSGQKPEQAVDIEARLQANCQDPELVSPPAFYAGFLAGYAYARANPERELKLLLEAVEACYQAPPYNCDSAAEQLMDAMINYRKAKDV